MNWVRRVNWYGRNGMSWYLKVRYDCGEVCFKYNEAVKVGLC